MFPERIDLASVAEHPAEEAFALAALKGAQVSGWLEKFYLLADYGCLQMAVLRATEAASLYHYAERLTQGEAA